MLRILRFVALSWAIAAAIIATTVQVGADGIVIPHQPCRPAPVPSAGPSSPFGCFVPFLPIKYHRVEVTIRDQVAEIQVDQAFENTGDTPLEATYVFPLPEDAAISDFTMFVDGEQLEGRLLDRDEARSIYEEIVRSQRDPALLEYIDRGVFQANVFPIPARGERRIQISYTQLLERENGLVRFIYPLSTEKFSPQPIPEVTVTVEIESTQPIRSVYSPSHDAAIERDGDNQATVSMELSDVIPRSDFELLFSTSDDEIGVSLTTYRTDDEAGYFLLLVSPKVDVDPQEVAAKNVVLVLDTSGSMAGEKIEQAKEAARYIVERLNEDDRFNIVSFHSDVHVAHDELRSAGAGLAESLNFIDGLEAKGSTNIHDALLAALGQLSDDGRPSLVIFLTDGLPTVGVTDPAAIVSAVESAAPAGVRLFTFGVGYDVNTLLLDELAQGNRGDSDYVRPEEDVSAVVSGFYERVSDPVLGDIALDFGEIEVFDIYPNPLPDLFAGSQLVMTGRYRGSATMDITLTGSIDGATQEYTYEEQSFPTRAVRDSYLPRLWATRKIGFLLNSVRFDGPSDEVVEEIVELSKQFGIITPYTSFLVEEPGLNADEAAMRFRRSAVPDLAPAAGAPSTGSVAVDTALEVGKIAAGGTIYSATNSLGIDQAAAVRNVGDHSFFLDDGVWTDASYDGASTAKIGFASDGYFDVLEKRPDWGAYFALGEQVLFVVQGRAYEIASGDFPPVDVPAQPQTQPPEERSPSVPAPQPETSEESSTPWPRFLVGGAVMAAALLGGGWTWRRRRAAER